MATVTFQIRGSEKCLFRFNHLNSVVKGAGGSEDLKISKSTLLFLNPHNFSNTEPIYTKSLLNYLAFEFKNKMVNLLLRQQ